ncbi:Pex19-domain-containing protein [Aureobasidium pullulans]|uniref:Pex19-domain-containing protein n=1 Tax=Aureobasidium pullulans TaxID=5580 RepID=A0A4S8WJ42_AURPU|nr:Pex19-domain-containing protein [Aureobasidium pullulans]THW06237.1 Pex19-domain-containing protein [Aureobasidium pullulans]THW24917.1 Pex19-domain-containing protein [Aureobasidium pullulans]THX95842.1 Pex19-domain-containing protein [Aureobasidium pullulans]THY75798.1 Pex19-domain-containing protein [Aureobasidium pullulans]
MADKQAEQHVDMAPDPDEDDLSDLDDMLDDFSTASIQDQKQSAPAATAASSSNTAQPTTSSSAKAQPQAPAEDDDFARQLQAGMAELLGGLGEDPEMQKQFEQMMKELSAAAEQEAAGTVPSPHAADKSSTPKTAPTPPTSSSAAKPAFASTIEKTMERMQASGQSASAAAASSSEEDMLAKMLKDLESGNFPAMDGDQGDFNSMLMGMMEQLVNKDILYEPMKELHDNFPDWLEKNKDSTPKEDLERYKTQQSVVKDIVDRFEKKDFNDENKEDREYIVDKMQQMQAAGAPPPGLVGDMNAAQDMLSEADGCNQQ